LRHGHIYRDGSAWTLRHRTWLSAQCRAPAHARSRGCAGRADRRDRPAARAGRCHRALG
jgi:hypothetical protein